MQTLVVEIPQYIRQIEVSKKQLPKYYELNAHGYITGKKAVLKKYIHKKHKHRDQKQIKPEHLCPPYQMLYLYGLHAWESYNEYASNVAKGHKILSMLDFAYKSKTRMYDMVAEEPVLVNEAQAGKPKLQIIKGQDFYSQNVQVHTRNKIMEAIKQQMAHYVAELPTIQDYPLIITMELFDTVDNILDKTNGRWDVDNRAYPYAKAFPDLLTNGYDKICAKKIKDDDRLCITGPPQVLFTPIENEEERKLVFTIRNDVRLLPLIRNYKKVVKTVTKGTKAPSKPRQMKRINLFNIDNNE